MTFNYADFVNEIDDTNIDNIYNELSDTIIKDDIKGLMVIK